MSEDTYDLAIIGAGSTGLIAADFAVKLGARVALLERTGLEATAHGLAVSQASPSSRSPKSLTICGPPRGSGFSLRFQS